MQFDSMLCILKTEVLWTGFKPENFQSIICNSPEWPMQRLRLTRAPLGTIGCEFEVFYYKVWD